MSGRLVQLKLVDLNAAGAATVTAKAALVLQVEGENVSIENSALFRASSHRAWSAFQEASRRLLGVKDVLIFRLEGSKRPLCSVLTLLGQPSNMVSVIASQVPRDPLPPSTRCASASPSNLRRHGQQQQQQQGAAELDGLLRRTQEICRSLTSSSPATPLSASLRPRPKAEGRATRSLDTLSPRAPSFRLSLSARCSSAAYPASLHGLDECDLEVERLLELSDSLTQLDPEGNHTPLPDAPRNVTILRNFRGGVYVIWDPVRLDAGERNNGHLVTGYSVSLNRQVVTRATTAVSCQVELDQLEPDSDYMVTVRTCGETFNSAPSRPVYFTTRSMLEQPRQRGRGRAANPLPLYRSQSARPRAKWPSGSSDDDYSPVPGLTHSTSACTALPSHSDSRLPSGLLTTTSSNQCSTPSGLTRTASSSRGSTPGGQIRPVSSNQCSTPSGLTRPVSSSRGSTPGGQIRPVSSSRGSTPGGQTRPVREVGSQSSIISASSGIFTDYLSPKSSLPHSRHASTSPSPLALKSHTSSSMDSSCRPKSSVWSEINGAGPLPPSQVRARLDAAALSVSWEPVRRDKEGRSNGFYVLGYRVYASGHPVASVNGAGSDHVLVELSSALAASRVKVDVRTRAISGESEDASTLVYSTGLGLRELCTPALHSVSLRCETCV